MKTTTVGATVNTNFKKEFSAKELREMDKVIFQYFSTHNFKYIDALADLL